MPQRGMGQGQGMMCPMISVDIVTLDDSLVQRLKVNRHTGMIEYVN